MFYLDIPSTETMTPFDSQPEAMSAFYKTNLSCAVWNESGECLAEKYLIEGEHGEMVMEEDIIEDAEFVEL